MENIIINDSNINEKQAELLSSSVRAVLYYNDNVLVEKSFDGSILLPGSVFRCPAKELLIKDLSLKLGYEINESELTKFLFLNHFYDGMIARGNLASTDYFYGKFRGIDYTKSLKANNYLYKLIDIDELIEMTDGTFDDVNVNFNNRETHEALKVFKKIKNN